MNLILLRSSDQFEKMKDAKTYFVIVIEDTDNETIVAATTLFLEYKFIHGAGLRGRIEDVVVSQSLRGHKLGKVVVDTGVQLSRKLNCYKLSLDCRDELIPFYQSLGFKAEKGRANMLVQRFSD
jgi:glucosamine-phosphate N-acetyltransferase